ncbi:MAG: hypothetical protein DHS20C15_14800 [Planctomycetota bacterium]|nr:MAG: hypothetical protein DHS20C15_14800 [Planctomycetota bacterium]
MTKPTKQPPKAPPGRMGSMLSLLVIATILLLVMNLLSPPDGDRSTQTFQNLMALAYQNDIEQLTIRGDDFVNAQVVWEGKTENWESVAVPPFSTEKLATLQSLFERDVSETVGVMQAYGMIESGEWLLVGGYSLKPQRSNFTGLFIEYLVNGRGRWAHLLGNPDDPVVGKLIALAENSETPLRPAPIGQGKSNYEPSSDLWSSLLITLVPWLLLIGFFMFLFSRQMRGGSGGGGIMSFGRSRVKMVPPDQAKITFDQVAGVEEAKEEVGEIIDFLKDPKRFGRLGGRIPKGVLLVGQPGTGKTLLAKAIAGEANVPFFAISGSDFVEMFVGVGASRVRDLFKQARENAPCVIFLDEIDAVGRKRGAGLGGGHDEREQTLNAILVEMDGFETDAGVIMIAATNRPDVLDAALLRPGRFDRQVTIDLPDLRGREAILVVHSQKIVLSPEVDLSVIARGTPMFSGAELEALINEAALIATIKSKEAVDQDDLEEARDKVRFGREKRSRVMTEEDKRATAYHEAGHAVVTAKLKGQVDPVHKVTIIPRGMALGATMSLPERDKYSVNRRELESLLAVLYGGRVAEELFCDDISGGAANDIERATEMARNMVCSWGMSDALGPVSYGEQRGEVFLGDELMRSRNYSEKTSQSIDAEVRRILEEAHQRAHEILSSHRDEMERVTQALVLYETITGADVDALLEGARVEDLRPAEPVSAAHPPPGSSLPPSGTQADTQRADEDDDGLQGQSLPVPGPA